MRGEPGKKQEDLNFAIDVLERYYEKHKGTIQGIIGSQWVRGMVSGRGEALNILREARSRLEAA
jgi:hypothetical protein